MNGVVQRANDDKASGRVLHADDSRFGLVEEEEEEVEEEEEEGEEVEDEEEEEEVDCFKQLSQTHIISW